MDFFSHQSGSLFAEAVPVSTLAERFGTPLYVYSKATLEHHLKVYQDAFSGHPGLVCYAVKANSNLAVLQTLAKQGAGFDIVSGGELERVVRAGGDPKKVVFSGVGKQVWEIERALDLGIFCFNVESEAELERIRDIATAKGVIAPISLRVNPDVDAKTHPYISTGLKDNKFGIPMDAAEALYLKYHQDPAMDFHGVDCHIGSQLTEQQPFVDAFTRLLSLVDRLADAGVQLQHIDIGGGLGVRYKDETPPLPAAYIAPALPELKRRGLSLLVEPGRSIAANAGIFITQVELLKYNGDKPFAVVDGAMNDLIRPSLYSAWQRIEEVTPRNDGRLERWDIVGPVCETGDFLGKDRELNIQAGDLLAIRGAGAYGFVMASNYNSRPRAAEVMVDGDQAYLVRRRETLADLLQHETAFLEG
jgi:diaminopimelate decarboxylase